MTPDLTFDCRAKCNQHAIGYAKRCRRSHNAVIRVYDEGGNGICNPDKIRDASRRVGATLSVVAVDAVEASRIAEEFRCAGEPRLAAELEPGRACLW